MDMTSGSFNASAFSKIRKRLLEYAVTDKLFRSVGGRIEEDGLMRDEHFTVDGTLIEASASLKRFKNKDKTSKKDDVFPDDKGNTTVNFHGEKRSEQAHASTTDSDARLMLLSSCLHG